MADIGIGEASELLRVSADTVRRLADSGELPARRGPDGRRLFDAVDVARYVAATAPSPPDAAFRGQSARNRFDGIVTRVVRDGVMAQVELQAGPHRIVSLMSREAADELGLEPGVRATAAVKATNVIVETP